ncbi:hypothetical protein CBO05C_2265 [Clostridium botulinum B str. Osaka05]|uniref:Uncharacterized protein n=1 Tax=Clostridium botulinum B str. Osaka05 TaxID=1407017 RepID=A0A0S6U635_CLOBO|nr:hypothetical protein CBO05C_2265 [Clostridium botulinum B str. Osaka05]
MLFPAPVDKTVKTKILSMLSVLMLAVLRDQIKYFVNICTNWRFDVVNLQEKLYN